MSPWWIVDLQNDFYVTSVVITNRRDCCSERLRNFEVKISIVLNLVYAVLCKVYRNARVNPVASATNRVLTEQVCDRAYPSNTLTTNAYDGSGI